MTAALNELVSSDDRDSYIIIRDASFWQFETMIAVRGDASNPLIAYVDGVIELMSPSQRHETVKTLIARLIEAYADAKELNVEGRGSETLRHGFKEVGAEPDECYSLGVIREFPELVVEVVKTHGSRGIDKFQIYSRLGVREFWRWVNEEFTIYHLRGDVYVAADTSLMFPQLDMALFRRLLTSETQSAAVKALRKAI